MATEIKCPKCNAMFPMEEAVSEDYKRDLQEKMVNYKKQKDEELRKHKEETGKREKQLHDLLEKVQDDYNRKFSEEKQRIRLSLEEELRRNIVGDFENQ